jgi:hypothetical protein
MLNNEHFNMVVAVTEDQNLPAWLNSDNQPKGKHLGKRLFGSQDQHIRLGGRPQGEIRFRLQLY